MAVAIPFGLAIGLSLGMLGGGGAVLAVPVLVYVLDQDVHAATTSSLAIVAAAALAGGLAQTRERRVCWRHAIAFTVPAVAGVAVGTVVNQAVGSSALLALFAVAMLGAAWVTWRKGTSERDEGDPNSACPPLRLGRDTAAGFVVGALTGFLGVGGGFVVVPALAVALRLPMRFAIGTSLVVITAVSATGLVAHLLAGSEPEAEVTVPLTAACVAGALVGAAVGQRVSPRLLARGFALLLLAVATYLLLAAAFLGGPPDG